ncbi:DegT/DnrJ/EryC1/StrS aminotransferase family protein [Candidatus Pelagibacter sp. HIMB1517]|uniref:DegT/DnrJ/EryC1/StrS aminotransferase family protein n=1 Tax=Candidatus Pelagibacter sp. HIMB1517 TaxID=3413341 RepID=UPI003F858998
MKNNFKINWSSRSHKFTATEKKAVIEVMNRADPLTQGKYLQKFENDFKKYLGTKGKVFGVTSGASAIELAAASLNLKATDEVIIPAHTYCASALPFTRYKSNIKWADIDLETMTISEDHLKKLISKKTKAIVVVHLYGLPSNILKIRKIIKSKKILLIEDCAQALGAKIKNKKVGTFGDFAVFSFHAQKNITTLGEGGVLVVNNKKYEKFIPGLRHNGHREFLKKKKYWQPAMVDVCEDIKGVTPFNFPMTEVQANLGSKLIKRIDRLNSKRIKRAKKFIKSMKVYHFLKFQKNIKNFKNVYHLLPARIVKEGLNFDRDKFISVMSKKFGIKVIVQFYPLYRYDFFKKYNKKKISLKNTDLFFDNMISFPFHEWMSEVNFNYMINSTHKTIKYLLKLK